MVSIIEMVFYISLAVMLCLLFLLINHLKGRIITLEKQNEGIMDVMKMIRGNLVSTEKEQQQIKESVILLGQNLSQLSSMVMELKSTTRGGSGSGSGNTNSSSALSRANVQLEIQDLSHGMMGKVNSETWTAVSEETETEVDEDESEKPQWEVVEIDWPENGNIEIRKLSEEDLTALDEMKLQHKLTDMSTPMFMHSSDASEIQKLFFMMTMGNGMPLSTVGGRDERREYEILPENYDDPDVESLPDSLPDLIPCDETDLEPEWKPTLEEEVLEESEPAPAPIDSTATPTEIPLDVEENSVTPTTQEEPEERKGEETAVETVEVTVTPEPVSPVAEDTQEEEAKEEEEKPMDFSKMDLRTLRSLVLTQGKLSSERVSKMKKAELVRLLSSHSV
jgi:hypothetical protein